MGASDVTNPTPIMAARCLRTGRHDWTGLVCASCGRVASNTCEVRGAHDGAPCRECGQAPLFDAAPLRVPAPEGGR